MKGQAAVPKTEFLGGSDILGLIVHDVFGQLVCVEVMRYLFLGLNCNLRVDRVYEQIGSQFVNIFLFQVINIFNKFIFDNQKRFLRMFSSTFLSLTFCLFFFPKATKVWPLIAWNMWVYFSYNAHGFRVLYSDIFLLPFRKEFSVLILPRFSYQLFLYYLGRLSSNSFDKIKLLNYFN